MKPENIFVSNKGRFKLGDFDLSKIVKYKGEKLWAISCGLYQPPELKQIQNQAAARIGKKFRQRADIYSLGLVLALCWVTEIFEKYKGKPSYELIIQTCL